jgi:hypothetical protein
MRLEVSLKERWETLPVAKLRHLREFGEAFEIEFLTLTDMAVVLVTLRAGQIQAASERDAVAVRGLESSIGTT